MSRRGERHRAVAHGCLRCGWRYRESTRWLPAKENGLCARCRTGLPRPIWELSDAPALCCLTKSRQVRDKRMPGERVSERDSLDLGGPLSSPWYLCDPDLGGCGRTFPFRNPGHGDNHLIWDREIWAQQKQEAQMRAQREAEKQARMQAQQERGEEAA